MYIIYLFCEKRTTPDAEGTRIFMVLLVCITIYCLSIECLQLAKDGFNYFTSIWNLLEWCPNLILLFTIFSEINMLNSHRELLF